MISLELMRWSVDQGRTGAYKGGSAHDGNVARALEGQVRRVVVLENTKGEAETCSRKRHAISVYTCPIFHK
jgi:hypothetical protein